MRGKSSVWELKINKQTKKTKQNHERHQATDVRNTEILDTINRNQIVSKHIMVKLLKNKKGEKKSYK